MDTSSKSVSGRSLENVYYVVQFFKQEKQHKLDINITAETSEATGISDTITN